MGYVSVYPITHVGSCSKAVEVLNASYAHPVSQVGRIAIRETKNHDYVATVVGFGLRELLG